MSQLKLAAEAVGNLVATRKKTQASGAEPTSAPNAHAAENTITALTQYIPVEVVALYLATVSSQPALASQWEWITPKLAYLLFCSLTPAFFLLVYYNQLAIANEEFPNVMNWPWWRIVASTIAFSVWALAIPNNPFVGSDVAGVVSGLAAIFVSTILSLLGPIFERPLPPSA